MKSVEQKELLLQKNNGTYNMCCTYLKHIKKELYVEWMNLSREERQSIQDTLQKSQIDIKRIIREAKCK